MEFLTIKAAPFPKGQLPDILKKHDISVNPYAEVLFAHNGFATDAFPEELQIAIAALRELGFKQGATLQNIQEALPDHGLMPCPVSTGVFLRLAWKEQEQSRSSVLTGTHRAPDSAVTVFSLPLETEDSFPKGLYLRNVDGRLWLRGYTCDASYQWSGDDMFAFAVQNGGC